MPMVYISKRTDAKLKQILGELEKKTVSPSRVLKTDVIHAAIEDYAKKMDSKVK